MAQLANVYKFRMRIAGDPNAQWRPLGDIDGAGTRLIDALPACLQTVDYRKEVDGHDDPQPVVTFDHDVAVNGDDRVGAVFNHHEYGSRGMLNRAAQGDSYPFTEEDNQQVRIAVVTSAPPMQTTGFMVFQVANGRGIKTGVENEFRTWLREQYDLFLEMDPVAPTDAVTAAIEQHGTGPMVFRKLENPAGLFQNPGEWWQDGDAIGTAEYTIKPSRGVRLPGAKIVRFLQTREGTLPDGSDPVDFPDLATFNEQTYDELAVDVMIHGRKKTLYIREEGPHMKHAFSWELDVGAGAQAEEIAAELATLIPDGD